MLATSERSSIGMAWKSTTAFYNEIVRIPMIVSRRGRIAAGKTERGGEPGGPGADTITPTSKSFVPYWQIDPHRRTVKCRSFGSQMYENRFLSRASVSDREGS
jgi:hypothetical protein